MLRPGEAGRAIIDGITARQVIDSRGNPTVEADVHAGLFVGRASVPSGASKGRLEAAELRDGRPDSYHGMGVGQAVQNIRTILLPKLRGVDVTKQNAIDELMIVLDGTPNKGRIGANAILAVSMAAARASAASKGVHLFESIRPRKRYSLPVPMMNVINGGEHAGNELDVQEFVIEPVGAKTCTDAIRMGSEVYHSLKLILRKKYGELATNVGDEGGFAPPIRVTRDALRALSQAVANAGYDEGDVRMGIDAAASTFFNEGRSVYGIDGRELSEAKLEDFYVRLVDEFGLLTIEDPFQEDAFEAFAGLTRRLGRKVKVIGDDIYVTNIERIRMGMKKGATNAVLIKLNQIGTLTETEGAIKESDRGGLVVVVSHRSGETDDPFIAHLATAFSSSFIKAGAPARGERTAKYNELIRIEEELGSRASYTGMKAAG